MLSLGMYLLVEGNEIDVLSVRDCGLEESRVLGRMRGSWGYVFWWGKRYLIR